MHVDATVIAHPGSKKDSIALDADGKTIIIHITAPPEKGKANKAIIKLLSKNIGVGSSSITIVRGSISSTKILRIDGINEAQLFSMLGNGK